MTETIIKLEALGYRFALVGEGPAERVRYQIDAQPDDPALAGRLLRKLVEHREQVVGFLRHRSISAALSAAVRSDSEQNNLDTCTDAPLRPQTVAIITTRLHGVVNYLELRDVVAQRAVFQNYTPDEEEFVRQHHFPDVMQEDAVWRAFMIDWFEFYRGSAWDWARQAELAETDPTMLLEVDDDRS